jgi:hypothetical protein
MHIYETGALKIKYCSYIFKWIVSRDRRGLLMVLIDSHGTPEIAAKYLILN